MKNFFIIDLSKDKSKLNPYISETLIEKIKYQIQHNKKTLLYINKRGAYNLLICENCNHINKCPRCDIALSIHTTPPKLICHHCLYQEDISLSCNICQGTQLKHIWVGTQQIEKALKTLFPEQWIYRMDSDNLKTLTEKKQSIYDIEQADIIIGTKMMTTGFDIKNIGLIWIILIEQELQNPRYDTEEKIYSNVKQMIGRWGRSWEESDIIIQTFATKNEIIQNITELNYKDFFTKVLQERKMFWYPPFTEFATLRYKHVEKNKSVDFIQKFKLKLESYNDNSYEIILVDTPIKRNNQFYTKILIKWKNIRNFLSPVKKEIFKNKDLVVTFEW